MFALYKTVIGNNLMMSSPLKDSEKVKFSLGSKGEVFQRNKNYVPVKRRRGILTATDDPRTTVAFNFHAGLRNYRIIQGSTQIQIFMDKFAITNKQISICGMFDSTMISPLAPVVKLFVEDLAENDINKKFKVLSFFLKDISKKPSFYIKKEDLAIESAEKHAWYDSYVGTGSVHPILKFKAFKFDRNDIFLSPKNRIVTDLTLEECCQRIGKEPNERMIESIIIIETPRDLLCLKSKLRDDTTIIVSDKFKRTDFASYFRKERR